MNKVKVGAETLLHVSDWDEPCLIAQSEAGNAIVRRVAAAEGLGTSIAAERREFACALIDSLVAARQTGRVDVR